METAKQDIKIADEYLGDGVYASYDGYHIWLDLRCQDGSKIALEPPVVTRLIEYRDRINAAYKTLDCPDRADPSLDALPPVRASCESGDAELGGAKCE